MGDFAGPGLFQPCTVPENRVFGTTYACADATICALNYAFLIFLQTPYVCLCPPGTTTVVNATGATCIAVAGQTCQAESDCYFKSLDCVGISNSNLDEKDIEFLRPVVLQFCLFTLDYAIGSVPVWTCTNNRCSTTRTARPDFTAGTTRKKRHVADHDPNDNSTAVSFQKNAHAHRHRRRRQTEPCAATTPGLSLYELYLDLIVSDSNYECSVSEVEMSEK
ncbi:uncharacterized protein LOC106180247 isoform X2 [Lingula anatina]|uniref:Uncharacterized protein LOC106180247 isoform X2 n=1 Tax=Lingula anatina TaxID=7574 RepID=A0A1S3KBK9_LINAN|nr:uncharacterized protein LOC106180247 isoform X2 [Lingula anatina]|eukprot:XP_013419641.1 uncharacterized protein LOC106180247 isoform X2 [Lingula anatina]